MPFLEAQIKSKMVPFCISESSNLSVRRVYLFVLLKDGGENAEAKVWFRCMNDKCNFTTVLYRRSCACADRLVEEYELSLQRLSVRKLKTEQEW